MPGKVSAKLIEYLRNEGVSHVFGIPGGGLAQMLNEFYDPTCEIDYVICRQESGAAYMADGYFRASGKLGVVAVTSGPGATNALTGAVNGEASCSRMLILTGEVVEDYFGKGYLQEGTDGPLDVNHVFKNGVSYSALLVSGKCSKTLIEAALRHAGAIPHSVSHLSLPVNVTMEDVDYTVPDTPSAYTPAPAGAARSAVTQALKLLAAAERPLILLGNGCRIPLRDPETMGRLQSFVDSWGIPVMTTADGKGIYPETETMSLRAFGVANCIWPYHWFTQTAPAYDGLLVIGSALGELATNKWNPLMVPKGPIIQVDANPDIIGRAFGTAVGIQADAGNFLAAVAALEAGCRPPPEKVAARRAKMDEIRATVSPFADGSAYGSEAAPLEPAALCRVMQEGLPEGSIVMLDAGNCVGWGIHYLVAGAGMEVHASLDMGPMGFAVGAVVGAKLARPGATCVCLAGDGAFMMQGAEVSTAARNRVGAIWIVLDDNDLTMVSQGQHHFFGGDLDRWKDLYALGHADLARVAEGYGADAYTVHNPAEAAQALAQAVALAAGGKPQVIVAKINTAAEPPYYNPLYASKTEAQT